MAQKKIRVMVADGDPNLANRISHYLMESGFETKVVSDAFLLKKMIVEWRPNFLFIDMLFPGFYALECLQFLRTKKLPTTDPIHVVVLSSHNSELNVRNCLEAGADDFIIKPFKLIDILQRLALLTQAKNYNFNALATQSEDQLKNYFEMVSLMVRAANQNKPVQELRLELIQMISLALKAVRTSVIEASPNHKQIHVIRSSDDPSVNKLPLELRKYPEIQYVLRTGKPLFVESLEKDLTLSFVRHEVKSIQFDSMMVLPLRQGAEIVGLLSVRMPKNTKKLSQSDIKIAEIASQVVAITWKFQDSTLLKKTA